ncbi:methyltransferase domain-containing protein [Azonexus sp.]|jgi:ubiquinone/menaquinone biosynthesis C-methylase UbiE|uniref:methyltransferase domain-containing protein n=1 Tax=Azonexus sp. TaxID=1872668 RepID=UPI002828E076|nr:methyltransferase domain-containing protein [Azonexus sp.]MDR1996685.1 methyltransferase domain-containing protein [Azonexus sp.]
MKPNSPNRYTHGHELSTLASHSTRTAVNSAAYLLPRLKSGMHLLDIGCGPGTITLDLAALVAPGQVVGLENAEAPLLAARAEAAARSDTTTDFQIGDALKLPFENESFDVVHAHQVLQHLTNPVAALREMIRVCKPGGWIAARDADYAAISWYPELPELERWRQTYRAVARANGAEPDAGRRLRAWAHAAGIANPQITASVWSYADTETCRWLGNGQADRCAGEIFSQQAREQGLGAADIAGIVDAWRKWGDDPDAWFCMPHGELLAQIPH